MALRLHDLQNFRGSGDGEYAARLPFFEEGELFEIGGMVVARAEVLERGYSGTAMGERQNVGEVQVVARCPAFPSSFDHLCGVDEGSVHIEEDGLASDLELFTHKFYGRILGGQFFPISICKKFQNC